MLFVLILVLLCAATSHAIEARCAKDVRERCGFSQHLYDLQECNEFTRYCQGHKYVYVGESTTTTKFDFFENKDVVESNKDGGCRVLGDHCAFETRGRCEALFLKGKRACRWGNWGCAPLVEPEPYHAITIGW